MINLIGNTVGLSIEWFGTAAAIFVGLLAVAFWLTRALLIRIWDLLEEARQLELMPVYCAEVLEDRKKRSESEWLGDGIAGPREQATGNSYGR